MRTLLILLVATTAVADDARLTSPVTPTALSVELRVAPGDKTFSGTALLGFEIDARLTEGVEIHAEGMTFGDGTAFVRNGKKRIAATVETIDDTRVRVVPATQLKPGAWTIEIPYEGQVHDQAYGLYRFEHDGQPYLVSQLEADEARTVWPCFDEPGFKVAHQLTVTVPEGLAVITNAPEVSATTTEGWTTHTFMPSAMLPRQTCSQHWGRPAGSPSPRCSHPIWTDPGRR